MKLTMKTSLGLASYVVNVTVNHGKSGYSVWSANSGHTKSVLRMVTFSSVQTATRMMTCRSNGPKLNDKRDNH